MIFKWLALSISSLCKPLQTVFQYIHGKHIIYQYDLRYFLTFEERNVPNPTHRNSVVMKFLTRHKTAGLIVLVGGQKLASMGSGIEVGKNGKIEGETRHVGNAGKGTVDIILHTDGGQNLGGIRDQGVVKKFFEVPVVKGFIFASFDLFRNIATTSNFKPTSPGITRHRDQCLNAKCKVCFFQLTLYD